MFSALIFDFDGLILDTEVPVFEAWRENYDAHGHDLPVETYVGCVGSDFEGFDPRRHLDSLVTEPVDWEHWDRRRKNKERSLISKLEPLPGIIALLEEACDLGTPCVVASSSPRSWVEGHLARHGLLERFVTTCCLDDVDSPKPAPDLFHAAANAVGVDKKDALVLEDSLNGLLAATAAGIDCVIVPNRVTECLEFPGALAVLDSLEAVSLDHLAELRANP